MLSPNLYAWSAARHRANRQNYRVFGGCDGTGRRRRRRRNATSRTYSNIFKMRARKERCENRFSVDATTRKCDESGRFRLLWNWQSYSTGRTGCRVHTDVDDGAIGDRGRRRCQVFASRITEGNVCPIQAHVVSIFGDYITLLLSRIFTFAIGNSDGVETAHTRISIETISRKMTTE